MREHKYRAWDKEEKHFVYFELFQGVNNYSSPAIYSWAKLGQWQQFTGLLDRNGKEIYERDIIRQYYGEDEIIAEMVWDQKRAQFGLNTTIDFGNLDHIEIKIPGNDPPEIIGNIYENPELL